MDKKKELKITYHYVESKTPEEKEEAERRLHGAYKALFEATLESEAWKRYKANKRPQ